MPFIPSRDTDPHAKWNGIEFSRFEQEARGLTAAPASRADDNERATPSRSATFQINKRIWGLQWGAGRFMALLVSILLVPAGAGLALATLLLPTIPFRIALITVGCGVAVLGCALFGLAVIGPKIAQMAIDGAAMTLGATSISGITQDSFKLQSLGTVTNAGFLTAKLAFPKPIKVYWTQRPAGASDLLIGTLQVPLITINGGFPKSGTLTLATTFHIIDQLNMVDFATYMINCESFSWLLVGDATAMAFGLSFGGLALSKVFTLRGFNSLPNPNIVAFDLPNSDASGIHILTTALAINPSTITIDLGSIDFSMMYDGIDIGYLSAPNVLLSPGVNSLRFDGRMKTANTAKLSTLMSTFLTGGGLRLAVLGHSSTIAKTQPAWLNSAFRSLSLAISLSPPRLNAPIVSGLNMFALKLGWNPSQQAGTTVTISSPLVTASFNSPYPFRISVLKVEGDLNFINRDSGLAFAAIHLPWSSASLDADGKLVELSICEQNLAAIPGREHMFCDFLKSVLVASSVYVSISGFLSAQVDTDGGKATIRLPITDIIKLGGLEGMSQIRLDNIKLFKGDADAGISINADTFIVNPSTNTLCFNAPLQFDIHLEGHSVGKVLIPAGFQLGPGENIISSGGILKTSTEAAEKTLLTGLTKWLQNEDVPIQLLGHQDSIFYDSLKPAFCCIDTFTMFPGQKVPLIVSGSLSISFMKASLAASLILNNALDATLSIVSIKSTVYYNGKVLGTVNHKLSKPLTIEPKTAGKTEALPLTPAIRLVDLELLIPVMQNTLAVDTVSTIQAVVGTYETAMNYSQAKVQISIKLL
ncbi:hypothetical protein BC830DRAFT_1119404 [Chytriomyces sp. MP71]|nr:hypothetical protein BC830DRAFT_1119404 [Chytriomyces sp. MP71]